MISNNDCIDKYTNTHSSSFRKLKQKIADRVPFRKVKPIVGAQRFCRPFSLS